MKTALDLLEPNTTDCGCKLEFGYVCSHEAELVAQRAREDMRIACLHVVFAAPIIALTGGPRRMLVNREAIIDALNDLKVNP